MPTATYQERRSELETYFDRTAVDAWKKLTSDAPVGRIRATVRAGRDAMRGSLLSWLPQDLTGRRILDAGCGTGSLAVEAARRGADVIAVDLSEKLIGFAQERTPDDLTGGRIRYVVGDFADPGLGQFDHIVAMDSLIHYRSDDMVTIVARLAERCDSSILFTFAPRTPMLAAMHTVGRLFPKSDRAPAIEPVRQTVLRDRLDADERLAGWRTSRSQRIDSGFYKSHAQELIAA